MKEDFKDFETIEHLLLNKRFEELNPAEVKEVSSYFEGASEYNDMRETLIQVKSTLASDKLLIKPNVELKEKLLQKFENTYTNTKPHSGANVRPFYKNIKFQWAAAASVMLLLTLSIFLYVNNLQTKGNDDMALNYDAKQDKPETVTGENSPGAGEEDLSDGEASKPVGNSTMPEEVTISTEEERISTMDDNQKGSTTKLGESSTHAPATDNSEIKLEGNTSFGNETRTDNNTSKDNNPELKREEKANYYFNDVVNEKENKKTKADKTTNQPNKSVNTQSQSIFNTTVNPTNTTTDRDYWKRNKDKNKEQNTENVGGLAEDAVTIKTDSIKSATDSLSIDSKDSINRRSAEMELDEQNKVPD